MITFTKFCLKLKVLISLDIFQQKPKDQCIDDWFVQSRALNFNKKTDELSKEGQKSIIKNPL